MPNIFPNESKGKGKSELKTELDLHIDNTNTIRNNVSAFWWDFTWVTGDIKEFTLPLIPVSIDKVYLNGRLIKKYRDYKIINIDTIEILTDISTNSDITVDFHHFVTKPDTI